MAESENQYRKWAELSDRQALGETLSPEERAFCEQFAATHPASRHELELLSELADLDVAPNADSRALVDATLERLANESAAAEREELTKLKRGARVPRFVWASGAAAVLAIAAAIVLMPRKPAQLPNNGAMSAGPLPRVELVYAAGDVRVDGQTVSGSSMLLAEGSLLEVGDGSACVAMDPEISVCAAERTQLRLSRTHSAWRRLDLESGTVALQLAPQPEGFRLSVVADGVWSTAVGTAFSVERDPNAGVQTTVLHGKVRVGSDGGDEQMVAAHERAQVRHGKSTLSAISRSEESPQWALLRPVRLWSNPVSSRLEVRGLPAGATVSLDEQELGVAPLSTLIPAGSHKLDVVLDGRVVATREVAPEVGQLTVVSFEGQDLSASAALPQASSDETAEPSASLPARMRGTKPGREEARKLDVPVAAAPASAAELLADARRSLREGRFDEAAEKYQTLRQTYAGSPEARTVLVSLAELELEHMAQPAHALENAEQYLNGGNGALMEEARDLRIRALHALGDRNRELSAIEEFLEAHPRSFQAAGLKRRLAELKQ